VNSTEILKHLRSCGRFLALLRRLISVISVEMEIRFLKRFFANNAMVTQHVHLPSPVVKVEVSGSAESSDTDYDLLSLLLLEMDAEFLLQPKILKKTCTGIVDTLVLKCFVHSHGVISSTILFVDQCNVLVCEHALLDS